ncbi:hypothetical protein PSSHI_34760 [Photobacterium sp. R1]
MRAVFILIEPPGTDNFSGMMKVPEPVFIQALISKVDELFAEGVRYYKLGV